LKKATAYAEEALDWMIQDGVVKSLEIEAEWQKESALALLIRLELPEGKPRPMTLATPGVHDAG
jgi:phage gp46-like protein